MASLGVAYPGPLGPGDIAARSRTELDRPLAHDAELTVALADRDAVLVGAFQRASAIDAKYTVFRRGSGGAAVRVGPGTLWVSLALARIDALVPCAPDKILNRHVRPLLRALTRVGALAHHLGRDFISVAHRPAGAIGFAHDRETGRCVFEAFVGLSTPFALGDRGSFLGKAPGTLEGLSTKVLDPSRVVRAIGDAYGPGAESFALAAVAREDTDARADPPWKATAEEAIGEIGAGPDASGRFRVGGDLMVSRDALDRLEARVAAGDDVARAVDEELGAPGVAMEGVRSLRTLADVITRARA